MALRKPLVVVNGQVQEIPAGDSPHVFTMGQGDSSNAAASTQFVANAMGRALVKDVGSGGTTTLNGLEALNSIITVTGALTSNAILEIPADLYRMYVISNETTGAFSLSIKQASATPVAGVARSKRNLVVVNGSGAFDAQTDYESIVMTGVPLAPTMPTSADGFEVANTAFVKAAIAAGGAAIVSYTYDNRGDLRANLTGTHAVVDGLGLFQYVVGSDEPDDDESCFATSAGRWLLQAAHWDLIDAWRLIEESVQDEALDDLTSALSGAGSTLVKALRGSATCTIATMSASASTSFTGTVVGAAVGDSVLVTPPAALDATVGQGRLSFYAWVSAADIVTVVMTNPSAATVTTNSAVRVAWPISVFKTGT